MKTKLSIIKIGGNVIDDENKLEKFLSDFSSIKNAKILIHGGGKIATEICNKLNITTTMNQGRRITSTENLEVITMVYAGLINKKIVSKLQGNGCNALGLSGADANCIQALKRSTQPVDYGWVGDIQTINNTAINLFLENGIIPVFCAVSHDGNGQLLNTNADTIAAEISISLSELYEVELIYFFEHKGVLTNMADKNSFIPEINNEKYETLIQQKTIKDGMLPKLENGFYALNNKVKRVVIGNQIEGISPINCTSLIL
jgi:acetylglutamate kinase